MKKLLAILLSACCLLVSVPGVSLVEAQTGETVNTNTIPVYQGGDVFVDISAAEFLPNSGFEYRDNYQGREGKSLYTPSTGSVTFKVTVPETASYQLRFDFLAERERGSEILRDLTITGNDTSFKMNSISFSRIYKDAEITTDEKGNEIRPTQLEATVWQNCYLRNPEDVTQAIQAIDLKQGEYTITLTGKTEPLTIGALTLTAPYNPPKYEALEKTYAEKGYTDAKAPIVYIQGEDALYKSTSTLFPVNDTSSPLTVPYDSKKQLLNCIGGSSWQDAGQYLYWEFEVPVSGLYTIVTKTRQNIARGTKSARTFYIDGEIPCAELQDFTYGFDNNWQHITLGGEKAYKIYLEANKKHTLKMEATLGEPVDQIRKVSEIVAELNEIYTTIMIITSSSPDPLRDFNLDKVVPEEVARLGVLADELNKVAEWFIKYSGEKGESGTILETMVRLLQKMNGDADEIPKNFSTFKTNIGSLSDWLESIQAAPLEIDYIAFVSGSDEALPKIKLNFFQSLAHGIKGFFQSFVKDYSTGQADGDMKSITVWTSSGKDQSQVIHRLIDSGFTSQKNINVNLKLVGATVLLPATVSGQGPDVVLAVNAGEAINYALRGAAVNLKEFSNYEEISKRFHQQQLVSFHLEDGIYALPATVTFPVMFYRTDILERLNLSIPQTWDDVITLLPILMANNMQFAMPVSTADASGVGLDTYLIFLYQRGGTLYKNGGQKVGLSSPEGIDSFDFWTQLYTNYQLPRSYNFQNRFRTGELPLAIADYSLYNNLMISAPEIRGRWGMTLVPGTKREDGTIDRSMPVGGAGPMMLSQSKDKESAWAFMDWWTSSETQLQYGREMESILGPSARYNTANLEAMSQIPWSADDFAILEKQLSHGKGIEQVPGGYFVGRHLDNAFRRVVYDSDEVLNTILDYSYTIDQELANKREEFGFSMEGDAQ